MSLYGINPWEEAKEETKEEPAEDPATESKVDEGTPAPPESPAVASPMTPMGEARRASDLRNAEAALTVLENRYAQLRGEKDQVQSDFEAMQNQLKVALDENKTMREALQVKETEADESKREAHLHKEKAITLEIDCQAKDERLARLAREADDLREEVSLLTESSKTAKSAVVDMESQAKLLSAESIPIQYEVRRLKSEIDAMAAHTKWLDAELVSRNIQITALTKEHSALVYELRTELDEMTAAKESCHADAEALRKSVAVLESKVDRLASENLQLKEEASDAKLEADTNLISERRVIQLLQEQLELLQKRHDDVVRQMESMQALAREAADESSREIEDVRAQLEEEAKRIVDEQAEEYRDQISELKAQLEESNRLRHEAEDFMIESPARASRRTLAAISAGEEQKQGDEEEQLPLNLTDAYTLLRKTEQELRDERKNHKLAQLRLRRIEEDVKAKMPHYIRQRQDYETAVARDQESRQRLKQAMADLAMYRTEGQEARHDIVRLQKQNRDLQEENKGFALQVCAMLGGKADENIPISVEEIQKQNQALLREHRHLTDELQTLKSDPLRSKLDAAEKEIESLKEERQRSELYVASIVQQRDLLRAQLHLDSKVMESESEQASTSVFSVHNSERIKGLESKMRQLEDELNKSLVESIRLKSEKDAATDRVLRYEAQVTTLSVTVDSYLADVASAKAEAARLGADASYHRDKCLRLEDSLQRSTAEVGRVTETKRTLQNHNARLQEALTEANATCSRLKQEHDLTERKLRFTESQAENAKSAETRAAQEADRLRKEMASHESIVETMHRIDATINSKNAEESNTLKEEVSRLREQLSSEQAKHAIEIERLIERAHELEADLKDLTKKKDDATAEVIRMNEKTEASKLEVEALNSKCGRLESQLRSSKTRLGETDGDDEDVEASLQAKIDAIASELEATKADLKAAEESVTTYQKIAKESEDALAELTKATNSFRAAQEIEVGELQRQLAAAKNEVASRNEAIVELTNDLSGLRAEHDKEVADLKKQVSLSENELEQLRKDAEGASKLVEHLKVDVENLREQAYSAQNNYDRELGLHSAARTTLREAREELEATMNAKKATEGQVLGLQAELLEKEKAWEDEKTLLEVNAQQLEKRVTELHEQNGLLYSQLEKLGSLVEKNQEDRIVAAAATDLGQSPHEESSTDEVGALQKSVSELRELIRFLRSEKEMLQVQLDTARRAADRERAASAVSRRSLDEARNELRLLQSNETDSSTRPSSIQQSDHADRLRTIEDQVQLLHDSNKLLREEAEKLEKSLAASQYELIEAKKALEPFEQKQRTLEIERAGLVAEKDSLLRENEAWKGRLQSLVSKFNQIDPVEHENVLKQVVSLKKDLETLRTQKKATDEEAQRIKAMAAKVNKDLSQQKALLESQKKTIARLTSEKEVLASTSKSATSAKEREQFKDFKEKLKKYEEENASVKTELAGANERNDNLRDKLRQFQKVIATHKQTEKSLLERYTVLEGELSQMKEERLLNQSGTSVVTDAPAAADGRKDLERISTAADHESAATQSLPVEAANESSTGALKQTDTELPLVPPGGFNFGPDRPSTAVSAEKVTQPSSSEHTQEAFSAGESKGASMAAESVDDNLLVKPDGSSLVPAGKKRLDQSLASKGDGSQAIFESEVDKRGITDVAGEETPSSSDETQEDKIDDITTAGKEQQCPSGKKKEQSLKEKLLMQKKRRLATVATESVDDNLLVKPEGSSLAPAGRKRLDQPVASKGDGSQPIVESEVDKRLATDVAGEEPPSSFDETQDDKVDDVTKVGKEQRRPSGEKKEQSLKEKLLMQKKRRLEVELAQKKAMLSAKTIQAEEMAGKKRAMSDSISENDLSLEHSSKRTKPGEGSPEVDPTGGGQGTAGVDEPKPEATALGTMQEEQHDSQEKISEVMKDTEQMDSEDRTEEVELEAEGKIAIDVETTESKTDDGDASDPALVTRSVVNPFATASASSTGDEPSKIMFGKATAELKFTSRSEPAENTTLGVFPGSSTPPPFGRAASIVLPPGHAMTGFGVSSEASGVAYGSGAFLDTLKPPGSLPMAKFSFGKAGPITLPTPSITVPTASPFDAFPSAESAQTSGTRTEQLFGQPLGATESETNNLPDETGGVGVPEDTANQDASMGGTEDDGTIFV